MLSILIPVYNYDVYPLVFELQRQANKLGIAYEILVQDDVSGKFVDENTYINTLENCNFSINTQNLGRGKNINLLCHKSKYGYVLIMEADSLPEQSNYLENYVQLLSDAPTAIFGGVKYPNTAILQHNNLRWKYGQNREIKSLAHRIINNYDFVFTWNLLLKKEILLQFPFPEYIHTYGYEDTLFIKKICSNSILIHHIDNPLIHNNKEYNIDFIKKTERAVCNLHELIASERIEPKDIKLSAIYAIAKKIYLTGFIKAVYKHNKQRILKNLTSKNPNLYLLDFYKLGYYCNLKK